jgi:1-acyl-sn-glycerol-3-phosphate acyltransferase
VDRYTFTHRGSGLFMALVSRRRIENAEVLEIPGAYILAGNHLDILDAPSVFSATPLSKRFAALAANKWQRNAFTRWFLGAANTIYVDRENIDREALKAILAALKRGLCVGIAPEGTRSRTRALQQAKNGVAWIARSAGVPIIPMAHWGTEQIGWFKRPEVVVRFGAPITVARGDDLDLVTDSLMRTIAGMLPERYRGVYGVER